MTSWGYKDELIRPQSPKSLQSSSVGDSHPCFCVSCEQGHELFLVKTLCKENLSVW